MSTAAPTAASLSQLPEHQYPKVMEGEPIFWRPHTDVTLRGELAFVKEYESRGRLHINLLRGRVLYEIKGVPHISDPNNEKRSDTAKANVGCWSLSEFGIYFRTVWQAMHRGQPEVAAQQTPPKVELFEQFKLLGKPQLEAEYIKHKFVEHYDGRKSAENLAARLAELLEQKYQGP